MSLSLEAHKLPLEAASTLVEISASALKPGRLLLQPVYLLFTQNQKFVPIKTALDFFTPEELKKIQNIRRLYMPAATTPLDKKRAHGASLRSYLDEVASDRAAAEGAGLTAQLTSAEPEVSAEAFKRLPPAWEPDQKVSHDEATAWAEGFCRMMPHELMDDVRLQGLEIFRSLVLIGSWAVILALLTGHTDASLLDALRIAPLQAAAGMTPEPLGELEELLVTSERWIRAYPESITLMDVLKDETDRVSQRMIHRIKGVTQEVLKNG